MKKKTLNAIVGIILTTVILAGCDIKPSSRIDDGAAIESTDEVVAEKSNESATSDASVEQTAVEAVSTDASDTSSDDNSTEIMDGEALTEAELIDLQEYLSRVDNYGFTLSEYETPNEIDWGDVFNCGAGIKKCDYSKDALDKYLSTLDTDYSQLYLPEYDTYEGLKAISAEDVRTFVENKTGITDFDVSVLSAYTYIESEDVLFGFVDPFIYEDEIICISGVRSGNLIQIEIDFDNQLSTSKLLTLIETGDTNNPYQFYSSKEL